MTSIDKLISEYQIKATKADENNNLIISKIREHRAERLEYNYLAISLKISQARRQGYIQFIEDLKSL